MADILLFTRDGWKNLWKQNIIWLFSALPLFNQIMRVIYFEHEPSLLGGLLYLLSGFLLFVSLMAVPYLVYSIAVGEAVTIEETIYATGKFLWRFIGCSCLSILVIAPLLILVVGLNPDKSTQPPHLSNQAILLFMPFSIFAALPSFTWFGFFANDWGIWRSLKSAWKVFTAHFGVLSILGVSMGILLRIYLIASGILTTLIQSSFDITSLRGLNYINPSVPLSNSMLYMLLSGVGQIVLTPFTYSIFVFAFLKYSQPKKH